MGTIQVSYLVVIGCLALILSLSILILAQYNKLANNKFGNQAARTLKVMAALLQSAPVLTISFDGKTGKIIHANDIAFKKLGYSNDQLKTLSCWDFDLNPKLCTKENWKKFIHELINNDNTDNIESSWLTSKGQSISVMCNYGSLILDDKVIITCLANDINQVEDAVKKERGDTDLEVARVSQLEIVWTEIAHEINNPLSVLSSGLYLLEKNISNQELKNSQEAILILKSAVNNINEIIQNIRGINKGENSNQNHEITFQTPLQSSLKLLGKRLQKHNIKVELSNQTRTKILTSSIGIEQVLMNLLNNAIDAVKGLNPESKWIQIHSSDEQKGWKISIINGGDSINCEIIKDIFKPFFTTKGPREGTGVGLSICKKIITNLNGNLYVEKNSQYTTFVLEIPYQKKKIIDAYKNIH